MADSFEGSFEVGLIGFIPVSLFLWALYWTANNLCLQYRTNVCIMDFTRGRAMAERVILHSDMNCFYASVELLHHPELRGNRVDDSPQIF